MCHSVTQFLLTFMVLTTNQDKMYFRNFLVVAGNLKLEIPTISNFSRKANIWSRYWYQFWKYFIKGPGKIIILIARGPTIGNKSNQKCTRSNQYSIFKRPKNPKFELQVHTLWCFYLILFFQWNIAEFWSQVVSYNWNVYEIKF